MTLRISELAPGLYKVRKHQGQMRAQHVRGTVHLLRVVGQGDKRDFLIDHMLIPSGAENFLRHEAEDFEVIARLDTPTVTNHCITLTWRDDAGDEYTFAVEDTQALRRLFDSFPWLKRPFGFEPKKP